MADDKGYYVFWDYPKELKTDQQYTYKMSTTGGDMTGVTYEFKWEFTCDGVTTKETIASGLTSLTYTWTPTSVKFGPLMKKSKSGTLKLIVTTSTGKMTYSTELPLTITDSIKPSISGITVTRTNGFNDRSVSSITSHKLSFNVAGLYGATQSITVEIGANKYTKSVNAVAGNAVTKVEFDIGTFDAGTSDIYVKSVWIQVADSRGNTAKTSTSIDIYKYARPTVEASVYRDANEEAYIAFTPTTQTTVAEKANSINTFYARTTLDTTAVQTDLKTSPQKLNGADDIGKSYNVFVLLKDAVGGVAVTRLVLPSNIPVMDIGSDGKTVTFYGTSPETSTVESVNICDSMHIEPTAINICDLVTIDKSYIVLSNTDKYRNSTSQITPESITILDNKRKRVCDLGYDFITVGAGDTSNTYYGGYLILSCGASSNNQIGAEVFPSSCRIWSTTDTNLDINGSVNLCDSSGKLGVRMYRDGEGGEIRIYAPNATAFWFMDAFDYNLRFGYNGGSSYDSHFTQITTDGRLILSNNLHGITAYFSSNVYANKFASNNDYTKAFSVYCQWKDGANHDLLVRSGGGLYAAVGWAGSSSYKTIMRLRGQTCQYANASGTTTLSDERLKDDFQSLDKWEGFFDNLEPCAFKLKSGSSGRYHFGFKAQQVKESLEKAGLTTRDFAGFVTTKYDIDEDDPETTELYEQLGIKPGDDVHGLIYTEFVALQHNEIQKLKARVKYLESEINTLKQQ